MTVFLFDVDNTLLDNDQVTVDLRRYLTGEVGAGRADQYFEIFEQLRAELGYSDYLGALQRYRMAHPRDPRVMAVSSYLVNYPFDVVFQPRKVEGAGLWEAVGVGRPPHDGFPRQGHYADAPDVPTYPSADITIEHIGALVEYDLDRYLRASSNAASSSASPASRLPPR